jgi:dipeptidyl aminopeptidase/acylaminoacyl peptidase
MRRDSQGKIGLYRWEVAQNNLTLLLGDEVTYSPLHIRIAPNGRYLYFLQDEKGNELGHLTRIACEGGIELGDVTPEMTPYSLRGLEISRAGNLLTFTAVSQAEGYQLVCVPVTAGDKVGSIHIVYQQEMEFWEAVPSYSGELVATQSTHRTGARRYCVLVFDTSSGELMGELWDGPEYTVEVVAFSPVADDLRLLLTTTVTGFRRPLIWQPRTGERQDIIVAHLPGELVPLAWSPDGKQLLLSHFDRAVQQLYLYDVATERAVRLDHPPGTFGNFGGLDKAAVAFTPDGRLLAHWQNAANPLQLIELEPQSGVKQATLIGASDVPTGRPWRSVNFPSSDGVLVQGWLAVPEGDGPFPTILHMHGGPHVVMTECFSAEAQAWLDHGFAYMSINYRGSTTFGEAFRQKIWGEIGRWELEDMVAARAWLVEQGLSDARAIILHGASYGGYLTLWGLSKRPDLWAGGIALVAVADWVVNYEDAAGAMQGAFRNWFLGSPEEKLAQYQASSPISYAGQVQAPLLIYQGRTDTRTSARQMEMYEAKMKALGKDIRVQWFDAGHTGSRDVEKDIALQEDMMQFARKIVSK